MLLLLVIVCFGFGLIYLLPKSLHGFSKILLGPALGILLFTQIFLFLSFVVGANFISIAIATIMLFIISVVVLWKQRSRLPIGKSDFLPYIVIAIVTALLGWIWLVQTLSFHNGMFFTGGGGMYGDTALHAAYTSRLQAGEFPPQNPLYAGKILVYPFANDLFSSSLLTNGLDFNLAFALPQILFLLAFLVLFYETCLKFTNKKGFIVSLIILLLGWGIGGFIFLGSWLSRLNDFWGVLNTDVTNNPDLHLQLHNILTGLILPERSFLPGLVLGLLFFLNFWEYTTHKSLKYLAINGIILGALPFWHTHTFIYYSIFSLVVGTWLYYKEASKKTLFHLFLMFGLAFLLSLPFLWLFFTNHSTQKFISIASGWQNAGQNIIIFWLRNSLLVVPLAAVGMLFINISKKLFLLPAFVIFILANVIIFQPWAWDNIKLLSWSFVFFSILCAVTLGKLQRYGQMGVFLTICIVATFALPGVLSLTHQTRGEFVIYDRDDIALGDWLKTNTKDSEVFVSDPTPNNPIPSLGRRMLYLGYPGHLWVHGIDYSQREILNNEFLKGNFSNISNVDVAISYIVVSKNDGFGSNNNIKKIYENTKYKVYKL